MALGLSWHNCSIPSDDLVPIDCHYEDENSDRLTFDIFVENVENFKLYKPVVKSSGATASPEIIDDVVDMANSRSEFSVLYNCISEGLMKVEVTVLYTYRYQSVSRDIQITFSWIHLCEIGQSEYVHLLYINEKENGIPAEFLENELVTFDRRQELSQLLLTLAPPARSQGFSVPTVVSSSPNVVAKVRATDGVIYAAEQHTIVISYECLTNEVAQITISIPLPPFKPLVKTWRKDCQIIAEPNIRISSDPLSDSVRAFKQKQTFCCPPHRNSASLSSRSDPLSFSFPGLVGSKSTSNVQSFPCVRPTQVACLRQCPPQTLQRFRLVTHPFRLFSSLKISAAFLRLG